MNPPDDRLYKLLPYHYRTLDEKEHGHALRDLMAAMAEPFAVAEDDIRQMYEDWFVETCAEWALPYLGELVGWQPVAAPGAVPRWLSPRGDVANTLRNRRRKGTLPLLAELARDVAGWPALAVEAGFHEWLLAGTAEVHRHRGGATGQRPAAVTSVDMHDPLALQWIGTPRDATAHTAGVSSSAPALNQLSVALHVWRLQAFPVTWTRAKRVSKSEPDNYFFSVLGNDAMLFTPPEGAGGLPPHALTRGEISERVPEQDCGCGDGKDDGPAPRLRVAAEYYGPGKSFSIHAPGWPRNDSPQPVPRERVVPADLSGWAWHPPKGYVAVDPQTGRISFPKNSHTRDVRVTWHYGFSAPMGGGEYLRPLAQMEDATIYRLPKGASLKDGMVRWQAERDRVRHAIIEFESSGLYTDDSDILLKSDETLQVRAAVGARPVLGIGSVPDTEGNATGATDDLVVKMEPGAQFVLDGVIVMGGTLRILDMCPDQAPADPPCPAAVLIRHCTLVPGWSLKPDCGPHSPDRDSIVLEKYTGTLAIHHSISGSIAVSAAEASTEPVPISLCDSILDSTSSSCGQAIYDDDCRDEDETSIAHAAVTLRRCTVFGKVMVHAMPLAENSIFEGEVHVARRQPGCVRFCWVDPCCHTPRRYECQPETAMRRAAGDGAACCCRTTDCGAVEARLRVRPQFASTRYSHAAYAQLGPATPEEIRRGADDRSEMGAFHDLFHPQREENLRARLAEYTPAGCQSTLIFQT